MTNGSKRQPSRRRGSASLIVAMTFALLAGLTGCEGKLTATSDPGAPGPGGGPGGPGGTQGESPEVELIKPHIRRLTPVQFENTVTYAFGDVFTDDQMPQFGDDKPTIGLNNDPSSLRVSDVNIDSIYNGAQSLAQTAVTETPVVRDCVAASGDACWTELLDTLAPKLWRRPLTDEEREDFLQTRAQIEAAPGSRAEQAEFLLMSLIASPNMIFRSELGVADDDGVRQLSQFEVASSLSYSLWNAPPDDELYGLALAGELDDQTLAEQARRMMEDPRFAESLAEFFVDYLKIEAIFSKEKVSELGLTPEARASLVEGIRRDLVQIFSMPQASLLDPFLTHNFHVDAAGASFFGVPVTQDGDFEVVSMNPGERLGILSHPSFLSVHAGEGDSGIVKRGVFTLEQLLCVELGAPPANISETEEVPEGFDDDSATSREVLSVRHSSQAQCVGCHRIIDPAGFGFENFDGAGRYRTVEKGDVEIDASGELTVHGETLSYRDSIGYIDALVGSEALRSCLSDTFFTYLMGDDPRLAEREALYGAFDANEGSVDALIQTLVTTPSFSARQPTE